MRRLALDFDPYEFLRHITLMGDKLSFELFHASVYGPVTFQLSR